MPTVFANSRSILHAGDGLKHTSAVPDVCKTPSPGGPVPVPYVNIASSSDLAKGTKSVKIEGKSAATSAANLSTSVGDEPGTAGGGIVSSKTKGKTTWATSSPTVKLEGNNAVRFMDVTQQNGNTFNTAFTNLGGTGMAYADDFTDPCAICGNGPAEHRILETDSSAAGCRSIIAALNARHPAALAEREAGTLSGNQYSHAFGRGYMVGVMICKCGQRFAARSGPDRGTEFENACAGFTHIRAGASAAGLAAVNACPHPQTPPLGTIQNAWDHSAAQAGNDGYLAPGICAAQKLIANAGHAPLELTEIFFMPPHMDDPPPVPMEIPYLRTELSPAQMARFVAEPAGSAFRTQVLQNQLAVRHDPYAFEYGQTVGSCSTCQDILFLTNCPERNCP